MPELNTPLPSPTGFLGHNGSVAPGTMTPAQAGNLIGGGSGTASGSHPLAPGTAAVGYHDSNMPVSDHRHPLQDLSAKQDAALAAGWAGTGSTSRVVAAKLGETVSVKDFGAVGNGVANDRSAFQAALDTGKQVIVPPGDYKFDTTSVKWNVNGTALIGAGTKRSRILAGGAGNILFENPIDTTIEDIEVAHIGFIGDGVYLAGASQALRWRGYKNINIHDCYFYAFEGAAILFGAPTGGSAQYKNMHIERNVIEGNGTTYAFSGIHGYHGDGVWVRGNRVSKVARPYDFEQNGDSSLRNLWVVNNHASLCRQSTHSATNTYFGVHLATDVTGTQAFRDIWIIDNTFEDNIHDNGAGGASTIHGAEIWVLDGGTFNANAGTGCRNINVIGNTSKRFTCNTSNDKLTINVQQVFGANVLRNHLEAPLTAGMTGIRLRDCLDYVAEGNSFVDAATAWSTTLLERRGLHTSWTTALARGVIRNHHAARGKVPNVDDQFLSGTYREPRRLIVRGGGSDITNTTANNVILTKTLQFGLLIAGARLTLRICGVTLGITGAKNIGVRFNSADLSVFSFSPATTNYNFDLQTHIHIIDDGQLNYWSRLEHSQGATRVFLQGGVTGFNFAASSYLLDLVAWVANAADTMRIRNYDVELELD